MDAGGVGLGSPSTSWTPAPPNAWSRSTTTKVHDYRSRRPQLTFDTDRWVALTDFELALYRMTRPGRCCRATAARRTRGGTVRLPLLDLARHMGVERFVTVQGIPMGVPHTRPGAVTTSTTDPDAAPDNPCGSTTSRFRGFLGGPGVPGGSGRVPQRGFVAHVPHYLAQGTHAPGILAVLERVVAATGLELAIGDLAAQSLATQKALGEEVASDGELAPLVHALETQYDDLQASGRPSVPTAEEIGQVVEQFLADQALPWYKEE